MGEKVFGCGGKYTIFFILVFDRNVYTFVTTASYNENGRPIKHAVKIILYNRIYLAVL
jgi:hypothetical protein